MTSVLKDIMLPCPPDNHHMAKSVDQVMTTVSDLTEERPLIVELDETLFLRNSTQEYLRSIYPSPLGAVFIAFFKLLKPWRWFAGRSGHNRAAQDRFLVMAATVLFPWTWLVWRRRARRLAERYCNVPLAQSIDANSRAQLVIMTQGFDFVVEPLIRHFPMQFVKNKAFQLISWRQKGKRLSGLLERAVERLGSAAVSRSVVITYSTDALPLLESSAVPCLVKWPGAACVSAMSTMYIPLYYSEKVKNPGKAHFIKRVIFGHWAFGVIAWSLLSPHPVLNAFSLLVLTLSYWCVYEIGYQENDAVGEKYERKPTLSSSYNQYKSRVDLLRTPWPWCWAIALAIPGILLFFLSQQAVPLTDVIAQVSLGKSILGWSAVGLPIARAFALWLVYLAAIRVTFWVYNQANETSRIWIYPFLQVQRLFGFALLASTSVVGTMFLISFVIARWMQYCIYRCGGDRSSFPVNISCLLILTMLYASQAIGADNVMSLVTWQAAIAFTYCGLRATKKFAHIKDDLGWLKE